MCFAFDAEPPEAPGGGELPAGRRITLTSSDGTEFSAFRAGAPAPSGAGVVILPDVRGLFGFYERLAERFAGIGLDALAIDYFGRTAGTGHRGEDFEFMPHVEQTVPERIGEDVAAAVAGLRSEGVGTVFTVGFCFGGTYSFVQAATDLGLAGAVGFYGGLHPKAPNRPDPVAAAGSANAPVLGLFGGADQGIPAEHVEEFDKALDRSGVEHTVHIYSGAPHSFFDRSSADYADECADAWRRVLAFISAHTPAAA